MLRNRNLSTARRLLKDSIDALGCTAGEVRLQGHSGIKVVAAQGQIDGIALSVPIATPNAHLGAIGLSARPTGSAYTSAEVEALTHAATAVAVALAPVADVGAAEPTLTR